VSYVSVLCWTLSHAWNCSDDDDDDNDKIIFIP